jgi:hypothetical protein
MAGTEVSQVSDGLIRAALVLEIEAISVPLTTGPLSTNHRPKSIESYRADPYRQVKKSTLSQN